MGFLLSGSLYMKRSTMTSQSESRGISPLSCMVSRARSQNMYAMEWRDLLLDGIATSTQLRGESESQRAITGMFMYDASVRHWWSRRGSQTITSLGSKNFFVF